MISRLRRVRTTVIMSSLISLCALSHRSPKEWLLKRVRADRGFYDDDNFTYFEDQGYEYIVKAKMTSNMHKVVKWVCEHPDGQGYDGLSLYESPFPQKRRMVSLYLTNADMNIRQS